jgi:hypothetical protein
MTSAATCARQCQLSCISVILQLVLAVAFILGSLWLASLLLEPLRILGITTLPPGILFVEYDARL